MFWAFSVRRSSRPTQDRPNPGRARRPADCHGFTLMEVVLVLALIMALFSIVVVLMREPAARENVRKTADLVRAEWTVLRTDAMRYGEHRQFRYLPGTGRYEMIFGETADQKELPEGMIFVESLKAEDAREAVEEEGAGIQAAGEPEIWFYPDGTTSDVQLMLRNDLGMQIGLTLRGLTGVVVVDDNVPDAEAALSGLGDVETEGAP